MKQNSEMHFCQASGWMHSQDRSLDNLSEYVSEWKRVFGKRRFFTWKPAGREKLLYIQQ